MADQESEDDESYINSFIDEIEGPYFPRRRPSSTIRSSQRPPSLPLLRFYPGDLLWIDSKLFKVYTTGGESEDMGMAKFSEAVPGSGNRQTEAVPGSGNRHSKAVPDQPVEQKVKGKTVSEVMKPSVQMIEKRCDRSTEFLSGIWSSTVKQTNDDSVQENTCKVASNVNRSDKIVYDKSSKSVRDNIQSTECKSDEHENVAAADVKIKAKEDRGLNDIAVNKYAGQNKSERVNSSDGQTSIYSDDLNKLEDICRPMKQGDTVNTNDTSGKSTNQECFRDPNKFKDHGENMKPEVFVNNSQKGRTFSLPSSFNSGEKLIPEKKSRSLIGEMPNASWNSSNRHEAPDRAKRAEKDEVSNNITIIKSGAKNKVGNEHFASEQRSGRYDDKNKPEKPRRTMHQVGEDRITRDVLKNQENPSHGMFTIKHFYDDQKRYTEQRRTMKEEDLLNFQQNSSFGKDTGKISFTSEALQRCEAENSLLLQDYDSQQEDEEAYLEEFVHAYGSHIPMESESDSDGEDSITDDSSMEEVYELEIEEQTQDSTALTKTAQDFGGWQVHKERERVAEESTNNDTFYQRSNSDIKDGDIEVDTDRSRSLDYTKAYPTAFSNSGTLSQGTQCPTQQVIGSSNTETLDTVLTSVSKTSDLNTETPEERFIDILSEGEANEMKTSATNPPGVEKKERHDTEKSACFDDRSDDQFRKPETKLTRNTWSPTTSCPNYRKSDYNLPGSPTSPASPSVDDKKADSSGLRNNELKFGDANSVDDKLLGGLDELSNSLLYYYRPAHGAQMSRSFYYMPSVEDFAEANGFELKDVTSDGNCMFRSVADQLLVNGHMHFTPMVLRHLAVSYLRENPNHEDGSPLGNFLTDESWEGYLQRMERDMEWGDHLTLKALSEVLGRRIMVINTYEESFRQTELIPKAENALQTKPFFLSHVGEYHYMSLRPKDWEREWPKLAKMERMKRNYGEQAKKKAKYEHLTEMVQIAKDAMKQFESKVLRIITKYLEGDIDEGKDRPIMPDEGEGSIKTENENEQAEDKKSGEKLEENADGQERDSAPEEKKLSTLFQEIEKEVSVLENEGSTSYPVEDIEDTTCYLGHDPYFVDPVSLMPMPHFSYILIHSLMEEHIYTPSNFPTFSSNPAGVETILIGSASDRINAFLYDYSSGAACAIHLKDKASYQCVMSIYTNFRVHFTTTNSQVTDLIVDSSDVHSGYCRLRPMYAVIWSKCLYTENDRDFFITAPKSYMEIRETRYGTQESVIYENSYHGYHCPHWPDTVNEWVSRDRPAQWPSEELKAKVTQTGCDVIQRAHPKSKCPVIEWQFIFARAEKMLLKNLKDYQLYCYKVFKILVDYQTEHLQQSLRGTHLKAIFFYSCEEIPESSWKESAGGCVLHLISRLLKCLRAKQLPNFFIKENNMIDHLEDSDIQSIADAVESIRLFPLLIILFISERYALPTWNYSLVFEDISRFSRDRDLHRSAHNVFVPKTIKFAKIQAKRGFYSRAYQLIEMAYDELRQTPHPPDGSQVDIPDFDSFVTDTIISFGNLFQEHYLREIHKKRTKTDLRPRFSKTGRTLRDLLGSDCPEEEADIPIPNDHLGSNISEAAMLYLLSDGLYGAGQYKRAKNYAVAAIKKALKAMCEDRVDTSQIAEKELRNDVIRQNSKHMTMVRTNLQTYLYRLQAISKAINDYHALRGFMDELEQISEREPCLTALVIQNWEFLGEKHHASDFKKRMEQLHPKDFNSDNSMEKVD